MLGPNRPIITTTNQGISITLTCLCCLHSENYHALFYSCGHYLLNYPFICFKYAEILTINLRVVVL
ncbi:hypothetical protein GQ55_2G192300 [Panicum hallii var. hallii]|uniref:Uncharacterized protein n=2 Tax=Panicum hallii TaxID=206008 RepID=A0A2T7EQD9_9POAL|nr:hypothetical protein PAHAL_2G198700 [Panicum hallii]PUZ70045.1 hypothetical protein GQ55_2G192300 [Panicum hallii var. hallii]